MNPLVSRLMTVLGAPERTENVAGFLAEYGKLTDRFPVSVQNRATDHLLRNCGRQWPTPKACVEACVDAQEAISSAEAAKSPRRDRPKQPWEVDADNARQWAVDFCKHTTLGKQAFDEGWGKPLFYEAMSYARSHFSSGRTPDRSAFTVTHDFITYHKKYSRGPEHWYWIDRAALLGEETYAAIAANREQFGPAERDGKLALDLSKLFKAPLPPPVSEDQFRIEQETGAA